MKLAGSPRPVRAVSITLALLVLAPYISVPVSAAAANQVPAAGPLAAAEAPSNKTLCVPDFTDLSRSGGTGLGRVAAGRFSGQLTEMQHWSVLPDTQLRERANKLKLAQPLDREARMRLAADTGAEQVVYGTITTARIQEKPGHQAYVRMMVLVEDAKTGALLQSAVSEGTSALNPPATANRDELYTEALTNAAASFARYLAEPPAPELMGPPHFTEAADRSIQEDRPAPQRESSATATRVVTEQEAKKVFADVSSPDPVVIDIPRTGLEEGGSVRRPLLSNRTLKLLVGGILFAGLLYLGGGGGIGSTRPF